MQTTFAPHERGAHHGASTFSPGHTTTPGHAMQSAVQNPQDRGTNRGASSFAPSR
jgi:hypothetical protein